MAGTEIYLGTLWSAEQTQVTPVLRGPVIATSSTSRVAIVSSKSCIRESSAAKWSSGQEAINRKVATDLHGDDELWKQFI
jgi:hypothetical protein